MMNNEYKIGFIGCGNMASAIISGLINKNLPADNIIASNPSQGKLKKIAASTNIHTTTNNSQVANFADILILAVKPQILPSVCEQIEKKLSDNSLSNKLIISIVAGITTEKIAEQLQQPISVVRAMPNTPATICQGATGLFANELCTNQQKQIATAIFSAIGKTEWVSLETQIDVVTAIAGSSPAYVFLFIQSMIEQAINEGLNESTARNLATQAVLGAASLAQSQLDTSLNDLRAAVTSPAGTTAAAISSFEQNNFSNIVKQAVTAAVNRGKELGEQA